MYVKMQRFSYSTNKIEACKDIQLINYFISMKARWDIKQSIISEASHQLLTSSYCSATFNSLFDLLLILPAEIRIPCNIGSGLSWCSQPEAREVVPVGDLPIKHRWLSDKEQTEKIKCLSRVYSETVVTWDDRNVRWSCCGTDLWMCP